MNPKAMLYLHHDIAKAMHVQSIDLSNSSVIVMSNDEFVNFLAAQRARTGKSSLVLYESSNPEGEVYVTKWEGTHIMTRYKIGGIDEK